MHTSGIKEWTAATWNQRGSREVASLRRFDCCEPEGAGAHPRENGSCGWGGGKTVRGGQRGDWERGQCRKGKHSSPSSSSPCCEIKFTDSLCSRQLIWKSNDHKRHQRRSGECRGFCLGNLSKKTQPPFGQSLFRQWLCSPSQGHMQAAEWWVTSLSLPNASTSMSPCTLRCDARQPRELEGVVVTERGDADDVTAARTRCSLKSL